MKTPKCVWPFEKKTNVKPSIWPVEFLIYAAGRSKMSYGAFGGKSFKIQKKNSILRFFVHPFAVTYNKIINLFVLKIKNVRKQ